MSGTSLTPILRRSTSPVSAAASTTSPAGTRSRSINWPRACVISSARPSNPCTVQNGQATQNIQHLLGRPDIELVEGSVTDAQLVDELMLDVNSCIHLASAVGVQLIVNEPLDTLLRSVRGSNVVMHAAERHDVRVLFSSTSEV